MKDSEILDRAASLIDEPHKWIQGARRDFADTPTGLAYCALGLVDWWWNMFGHQYADDF